MVISTFANSDLEDSKNSYDDRPAPATYTVTVLSSTVLLIQSGSVHIDEDDTIAITQLVVLYTDGCIINVMNTFTIDDNFDTRLYSVRQVYNKEGKDNNITTSTFDGSDSKDHATALATAPATATTTTTTTTIGGYSTTTIDGELISLFRLAYRVNRRYRVVTILSSIVLLLQSGSVHDDAIAILQLKALYQVKCVLPPLRYYCYDDISSLDMIFSATKDGEYYFYVFINLYFNYILDENSMILYDDMRKNNYNDDDADNKMVISTFGGSDSEYSKNSYDDKRPLSSNVPSLATKYYSTTTIDGEWIVLFRLAYRVDRMYRVDLVVLYQRIFDIDNDNDTTAQVEDDLISSTTTVRRTLLSTVPSLVSSIILITTTVRRPPSSTIPSLAHDLIASSQLLVVPYQDVHDNDNVPTDGIYDRISTSTVLLFRLAYRVDIMYQVYTVLSPVVLLLQSGSAVHYQDIHDDDDTIAITQLVVSNQDSLNMISSATQNGEYNAEEYYCYADIMGKNVYYYNSRCNDGNYCNDTIRTNGERTACYSSQEHFNDNEVKINVNTSYNVIFGIVIMTYYAGSLLFGNKTTTSISNIQDGIDGKEKRLEEKYQSRALHSQGQYKDEVYNAEEGMFQEPILRLDYYLLIILICSFSRTSIGDGDETTTLISTNQNGEYKKIDDKKKRLDKYTLVYGNTISMIRLCLCTLLIVTMRLRLFGQSMGSVKIHKDRVNQVSQTRARLESTFGSTFGIQLRTLESCIQSDVFVCSSLLKLLCSFLLKEKTTVKNCLTRRCTYGTLIL